MIQKEFANKAKAVFEQDQFVIGMAVAGSWLTNEIDEYSDLDLILVTTEKIGGDKIKMLEFAKRLDSFLSGFTGEHVGDPRLLICLYDNPLLHVDIKFLTLKEFESHIETPSLIFDKNGQLEKILSSSQSKYPYPDYQWIEDRFWTWTHYTLLKIGRGEYLEAYDSLGYLRTVVLGPLLLIKNGKLPRGVRKVESELSSEDLFKLKQTLPTFDSKSLLESLKNAVSLYRQLRNVLFGNEVQLQNNTEHKVMKYFEHIENIKTADSLQSS